MTSKEKLKDIRDHLFSELCWKLDKDEDFKIKFGLMGKTNEDMLKYIDGEYGIDVIEKDLDRLEKYDEAKEIIKEKSVDISLALTIKNVMFYNCCVVDRLKLTQEELDLIKEVFG